MTVPEPQKIAWRRLGIESLAILVSILLAFAIDAGWDRHLERDRESDLIIALTEDFGASRALLEDRAGLAERMANGNGLLLTMLEGHTSGDLLTVPDSLVLSVLTGPTYEPNTSALDAALASGRSRS